eukprot:6656375-Lingulodinium_polyedra.AAC.1
MATTWLYSMAIQWLLDGKRMASESASQVFSVLPPYFTCRSERDFATHRFDDLRLWPAGCRARFPRLRATIRSY